MEKSEDPVGELYVSKVNSCRQGCLRSQTEDGAENVVCASVTVLSILILIRILADPSMTVLANAVWRTFIVEMS